MTVEEHDRETVRADLPEAARGQARRGRDQDPGHPLLLEESQRLVLARRHRAGAREDDEVVGLRRRTLHATRDLGEERVVEVEHDECDRRVPDPPQLARRVVPDEPERVDRREHALPRRLRHELRLVQHVRHRAERDVRVLGDVLDRKSGHGRHPSHGSGGSRRPVRQSLDTETTC